MPSVLLPRVSREILARRFWRNPRQLQHVRSGSTAQSIKTWEEDSGASPFVYGGVFSHAKAAKQPPTRTPCVSPKKSPQQASQDDIESRTRTTPQLAKDVSPISQDGNSIRDHVDFPTAKDYPGIPKSVFADPKSQIRNALQDRADFQAEFTNPSLYQHIPVDYQCTLTCKFRGGPESEIAFGRGTSKVSLADRPMNSLTVSRKSPRILHSKI